MIEITPESDLPHLLRDFRGRGGALDFAFYLGESTMEADTLHHRAATKFLDACAAAHFERVAQIEREQDVPPKDREYKWDPDALHGTRISFAAFWGTDDVVPEQTGAGGGVIPNVDGYKTAFFHPPYGLRGRVNGNQALFDHINRRLLGDDPSSLRIWSWSTDCSTYFEPGLDWWGAYLWTLSQPGSQTVTVIGASTSD